MEEATAGRVFSVDSSYRRRWRRVGWICLAAGIVLLVVGAALLTFGAAIGGAGVVLGLFGILIGSFTVRGAATTEKATYRLEVGAEELTVVWRDQVTKLPWDRLQWATVTRNGRWSDNLEVLPAPDFRPVLPANARPKPSRRVPGQLDVFSLSILGDAQADCLAEVGRHITLR